MVPCREGKFPGTPFDAERTEPIRALALHGVAIQSNQKTTQPGGINPGTFNK